MRTCYFDRRPPVPDTALNRAVARVGAVSTLVALACLAILGVAFGGAALYGLLFL